MANALRVANILTYLTLGALVPLVVDCGAVTGIADRAAGPVMTGYCFTTALLRTRFWAQESFWTDRDSKTRGPLGDFSQELPARHGVSTKHAGTGGSGSKPFLRA